MPTVEHSTLVIEGKTRWVKEAKRRRCIKGTMELFDVRGRKPPGWSKSVLTTWKNTASVRFICATTMFVDYTVQSYRIQNVYRNTSVTWYDNSQDTYVLECGAKPRDCLYWNSPRPAASRMWEVTFSLWVASWPSWRRLMTPSEWRTLSLRPCRSAVNNTRCESLLRCCSEADGG